MRLRRHELQMSLEDVAKASGIPNQLISRVETARIERPAFEYLVRIGRVLGWSPQQVAIIFGQWEGESPVVTDDRAEFVRQTILSLPPDKAEKLLSTLYTVTRAALLE